MSPSTTRSGKSQTLAWWAGKRISLLLAVSGVAITSCMWLYYQLRDYLLLRSLPPQAAEQLRALRESPLEHKTELWDFARQYMPVDLLLPGFGADDWLTIFLFIAASMPFMALCGLLASRPLTRQFASIARAARQVAAGHFDVSASVVHKAPSELVELTTTFNTMTSRLAQYQREVTESSAILAHELRTPLNAALGRLHGLMDGVFPRSDDQLKIISNQLEQMNRLVSDLHLLSMARSGSMHLEKEYFSVDDLLKERIAWVSQQAASLGVKVERTSASDLVIFADRDRIGQALTILLDNALRHGGAGGVVSIEASVAGDYVGVSVADQGPGVQESEIRHLTDRFWRSDASRSRHSGGIGLGLSIAAAICEAHGGALSFANRDEGGLVCRLDLPRQPNS